LKLTSVEIELNMRH